MTTLYIDFVLFSVLLAGTYQIFIVTVKITFVSATPTTEVGTCASWNRTDLDHLVLFTLSGKRRHSVITQ